MPFVLRARSVDIDTGGDSRIVLLRGHDAATFGINPGDRLQLRIGRKTIIAVADITHHSLEHGEIGFFTDIWRNLKIKRRAVVTIDLISRPQSVQAIKKKLLGETLTEKEVRSIIEDIVSRRLGSIETTYFVSSGYVKPYSESELIWMVRAMAETGETFTWGRRLVADKHSIGGLAGNRTTMVAIPIVAACGVTIPKTSSRAITSPAGTADTMEVLAPVSHSSEAVRKIVNQAGGCLIWGGGLSIAPADDIIIRVSRPLSLEPYDKMIVSIMAKKVAMGVKYLIIDMPYGHGTKVPNRTKAETLASRFTRVGRAFGMTVEVHFDPARQPIGNGVGPALEARDVLQVLQQANDRPRDLERKGLRLAGNLLELCGKSAPGEGQELAARTLRSGLAWKKMQDIIRLQGGNPNVQPDHVIKGASVWRATATKGGRISKINNRAIDEIARALGAPDHKLAGVLLHHKLGHRVKRGDALYSLYSHSAARLKLARAGLAAATILELES